jgi:hypothetical protein
MQRQEEPMIDKRKPFVKKTENQEGLPLESISSLLHLAVLTVTEAAGKQKSYSQTCNSKSQFYSTST